MWSLIRQTNKNIRKFRKWVIKTKSNCNNLWQLLQVWPRKARSYLLTKPQVLAPKKRQIRKMRKRRSKRAQKLIPTIAINSCQLSTSPLLTAALTSRIRMATCRCYYREQQLLKSSLKCSWGPSPLSLELSNARSLGTHLEWTSSGLNILWNFQGTLRTWGWCLRLRK